MKSRKLLPWLLPMLLPCGVRSPRHHDLLCHLKAQSRPMTRCRGHFIFGIQHIKISLFYPFFFLCRLINSIMVFCDMQESQIAISLTVASFFDLIMPFAAAPTLQPKHFIQFNRTRLVDASFLVCTVEGRVLRDPKQVHHEEQRYLENSLDEEFGLPEGRIPYI